LSAEPNPNDPGRGDAEDFVSRMRERYIARFKAFIAEQ
jgi:hypothetical protein